MDEKLRLDNTTITYRLANSYRRGHERYYPCLETVNTTTTGDPLYDGSLIVHRNRSSDYVDLPPSGITFLIPINETVCQPKISRYTVKIAHHGGTQNVTHTVRPEESIPSYHGEFQSFNGSFEQWVQFSDALHVYGEFAYNMDKSTRYKLTQSFPYDASTGHGDPHILSNGTLIDTCLLEGTWGGLQREFNCSPEIWPLSVFERRLTAGSAEWFGPFVNATLFDAELANELLINSTINMLSLNRHFDIVNGTTSRTFNVYQFRNKLAFFLPYCLALGLTLPIIALGLAAFYTRNQSVSAITGGFLQILMTTTGRGSLEDVIAKGPGTMGGHENVSEELKETLVRFGELIQPLGTDNGHLKVPDPGLSTDEERTESPETIRHRNNYASVRASLASSVEISEKEETVSIQAGFGTIQEVKPLRKRIIPV